MEVDHTAQTIAEEQPDVAVRLVRAKLDFLLSEARAKPEPPPFPEAGTEEEKTTWYFQHRRTRSEEHTSELQSLMRISYAVFCLKKKKRTKYIPIHRYE